MDNTPVPPKLNEERRKTDLDLSAEREKTDESLEWLRKAIEKGTDEAVRKSRRKADRLRTQGRKREDERRGQISNFDDSSHQELDRSVSKERQTEDWIVMQERDRLDEALKRERIAKEENVSALLERERAATNESLLHERLRVDSEVRHSVDQLAAEKLAHAQTKIALTERDEFLAIVSHDLRNPIGSISSCADMLLEGHLFPLDDEVKKWIEFIKRNADSSLRLISDLLDIERMAKGKFTFQLSKVRLFDLIKETIERYTHDAVAKSILLKVNPPPDDGVVIGDPGRIQQVLGNLVENGIKYTNEGGTIVIRVHETENDVIVSVKDTGSGISDDEVEHVFERFSQVHKLERRGLGLGLHISKAIIEAHGGKIWVDSKLGVGSTFYFCLPKKGPVSDLPL